MKVVFSASILDLCHSGHLNLLRTMRKRGDKVIMVLHDDYSCFLIKDKFPIWDLKRRIKALKMTGLVDKVMVSKFPDPTDQFKKIIKRYKKEDLLYIRGDDNKKFPGMGIVERNNIPIEFIKYTEGTSSTKIKDLLLQI